MSNLPGKLRVDLVEQGVYRVPEQLKNWRAYRIEYGGHGSDCLTEGFIWLPSYVDPCKFEEYLKEIQE